MLRHTRTRCTCICSHRIHLISKATCGSLLHFICETYFPLSITHRQESCKETHASSFLHFNHNSSIVIGSSAFGILSHLSPFCMTAKITPQGHAITSTCRDGRLHISASLLLASRTIP